MLFLGPLLCFSFLSAFLCSLGDLCGIGDAVTPNFSCPSEVAWGMDRGSVSGSGQCRSSLSCWVASCDVIGQSSRIYFSFLLSPSTAIPTIYMYAQQKLRLDCTSAQSGQSSFDTLGWVWSEPSLGEHTIFYESLCSGFYAIHKSK